VRLSGGAPKKKGSPSSDLSQQKEEQRNPAGAQKGLGAFKAKKDWEKGRAGNGKTLIIDYKGMTSRFLQAGGDLGREGRHGAFYSSREDADISKPPFLSEGAETH